jgi:hypothetical protein
MYLRKDDGIQMKTTEYSTHMELFFHKSIDGISISPHGLIFGQLEKKQ